MKKTAQDFGSHWNRPSSRVRTEESAETTCDSEDDYLGFRIVCDEAYRVCRGGSRDYGANYARAAYRNGDYPGYHRGDLGFRLAREET